MSSSESSKDRFAPLTFEQMYGVEEPEPDGRPLELEIDSLVPFPNQPFNPYKEEEMAKMVESIQENGVISPIIVRPKADGETYEIISGHNRVEACRRAGICQIPSFIREVDDDTAVVLMVDSNLRQREKLSWSEKARAFAMKLDALNRKAGRPKKNCSHDGNNFQGKKTMEILGEATGDSRNTVHRILRLNNLSPALMSMVDDGKLALTPAVEISYLDKADQEIVQQILERDQLSPSLSQAQKLRKLSDANKINDTEIDRILTVEKPMYETIVFRRSKIEQFFPAGMTGKEIEEKLYDRMAQYRDNWQREREQDREQER